MSQVISEIARKITTEVGTPRTVSLRIAKQMNKLAASVSWAEPVDKKEAKNKAGSRTSTRKMAARPRRARLGNARTRRPKRTGKRR